MIRENDRLIRKAFWRLLPWLAACNAVSYMDRANVSFAALNMNQELHFSATVFGFGAGIFFVSYAFCELPSNLLLVRFGARRWIARIMVSWGILASAMILVKGVHSFYLMRILLGIAEAGFFPGVIYYLSLWFPQKFRAKAISRFYCVILISSAIMGALAGALLNLHGVGGLSGWQWLFLVEGIPAVILGIATWFILPDSPETAPWLNKEEKQWFAENSAIEQKNDDAIDEKTIIKQVISDIRVWQLGIFYFLNLMAGYTYNFTAPLIVKEFGHFSNTVTGMIISLGSLVGAGAMLLNSYHSDLRQERYLHTIIPLLVMAAGCIVTALCHVPWIAIISLTFIMTGHLCSLGPFWSIPSTFLSNKTSAAGIAVINATGVMGAFVGPYVFGILRDQFGDYHTGLLLMAIPCVVAAMIMWGIRSTLRGNSSAITIRQSARE